MQPPAQVISDLDGRFRSLLVAIAVRRFHIPEADAQDLVHDLALGLIRDDYRVLRCFRGECTLATFLGGMMRHRCLSWKRSQSHRTRLEVESSGLIVSDDPHHRLMLEEAMEQINARDHTLLRLFYFEGRTYDEIGLQTGMPVNTVASCLRRARERLKNILASECNKQALSGANSATDALRRWNDASYS